MVAAVVYRYLLRERSFDQEAVDDLVALKVALCLKDEEVS